MIQLIYGNEPYLVQQEREKLHGNEMDVNVVDAWEGVESLVFMPALFSEKRTIIYTVERLGANADIYEYLSHPSSISDLYIFAREVDRNTKVYKKLKKDYQVTECNKLSEEQMKDFAKAVLAEYNATISVGAYALFMQRANYWDDDVCTLYTIRTYLYQMATAAADGKITKAEVTGIVPESMNEKVYMLTSYLLGQDGEKAFGLATRLLQEKESPIAIMSAVMRTFRVAYKASLFKDEGKGIGKLIGVPYFQYKEALRYEASAIKECMGLLQSGVNQIKQGCPSDKVLITTLGKLQCILK